MLSNIELNPSAPGRFCSQWKILALALFGSVLRLDFGLKSDVDVLVTLDPAAQWDHFDWIEVRAQLERLFGRPVDLIEKSTLRNPYRRKEILAHSEIVYIA